MQIISKGYDRNLKLRTIKDKAHSIKVFTRFKVLKNNKEWPCCDFHGKCTNIAYTEVYPSLMINSKKKGWSYLCKKHHYQEQKRLGWKLPACLSVEW